MTIFKPWQLASLVLLFLLAALPASVHARRYSADTQSRVTVAPTRASAALTGVPTIIQTLNHCGPASIAEVLAYWHITRTQQQVQAVVRADNSPRGMAPYGVPGYMRSLGMRGMIGAAGTPHLLKALITNGFPVIVSQLVSSADPIRHYRPIVSYDDRQAVFRSSDPYLGANHAISYTEFSRIWTVTDNRFLVLYPPSRQGLLDAVLRAAGWQHNAAFQHDLAWQQNRLRHPPPGFTGTLAHYYGYPNLAWDEMELGKFAAARRTLQQASVGGASPVILGWIRTELAWRLSHRAR